MVFGYFRVFFTLSRSIAVIQILSSNCGEKKLKLYSFQDKLKDKAKGTITGLKQYFWTRETGGRESHVQVFRSKIFATAEVF